MKSSCCNAFDFSMSWDGVLPSQAYVYFYQYFDYLRSLLTFWHLIDRLHFLHNLQNPAAPSFFCLFFCVKENYFLQLFLKKISAGYWQILYIQWLYGKIEDIFNTHFVPFIICFLYVEQILPEINTWGYVCIRFQMNWFCESSKKLMFYVI